MPIDMLPVKREEPKEKKDNQPINLSKEYYRNVMTMLRYF